MPRRFSRRTAFHVLIACALVLVIVTSSHAKTLWVDVSAVHAAPTGDTDAPLATISAAMELAGPGDTVMIRSGVYREKINVPPGEPDAPIVVRSAPEADVTISACRPIDGWKEIGGGIYQTTIDWRPRLLLVDGARRMLAREPNEGWWTSRAMVATRLDDPVNLTQPRLGPLAPGGQVYVWLRSGNVFATIPIAEFDPAAGRLTFAPNRAGEWLADGDRYWLENRRELIDRPGEWAIEPAGDRFDLYFMPESPADLDAVEGTFLDRSLVNVRRTGHARIEGLKTIGAEYMGVEVHGVRDVQVRRCVATHCGRTGISVRDSHEVVIQGNVAWANDNGMSVSYSSGVVVQHNDIGHNDIDGLVVCWQSEDITVRRNYMHHHQLWGHPDNFQVFRDVKRLRLEENLMVSAGQSVMMEESTDGLVAGNMFVGCGACMLILGHGNAERYEIRGNTFAFPGYSAISLSADDYKVFENVFFMGHAGCIYGTRGLKKYQADRNILFHGPRCGSGAVLATDTGWHRDFDVARASTGQNVHSVWADPKFRSAPIGYRVLDTRRLDEMTRSNWLLRGGTEGFQVNDNIEVNFDGVPRRVTAVDEASITVDPPLRALPTKDWLVTNWGEKEVATMDLRLCPDSPGAKLSATGGPIGSKIDIRAYQNGDFDGDGTTDRPKLPARVR